jgi:hypothetical protein
MTALVAVMNKQAVALAADSAGTVPVNLPGRDHHKIYAMNKVFALSKTEPVGAMICGLSQYLGLPWESIIKRFRRASLSRSHPTIDAWCDDFKRYLSSLIPMMPIEERDAHVLVRYNLILTAVLDNLVREGFSQETIAQSQLEERLEKRAANLNSIDFALEIPENAIDNFIERNGAAIERDENSIFADHDLKPLEIASQRRMIIGALLTRRVPTDLSGSQVVIAGFGADDWFPSVRSMVIDGVSNDSLRTWDGAGSTINHSLGADIVPYAQADIVWTLLRGIHPKIQQALVRVIKEALTIQLPGLVGDLLNKHISDATVRETIAQRLSEVTTKLSANIAEQLTEQSNSHHSLPVLASIQHLGKGELAQLAESLITTTSLKYRMAIDAQESVGGPVDVAVVSKDEGFIWIRRKHYFDIAINPSFRDQQAGL